ncbi:MAG: FAD-dependent oxidoreductase [Planctomycetaceae bacterium]|nr:FAD-dependent oxidoreductase [Planctomycetaceae bacterium]
MQLTGEKVCVMRRSLAIIGGGLAGIAAAEAAVQRGFKVDLFEWSRVLGGRAASIFDPVTGCWIDNGQHIALGCCNEFVALNKRLGLNEFFVQKNSMPFFYIDGKRWKITHSSFLPSSWQLLPSFLRNPLLTLKQRISTALALRKLCKINKESDYRKKFEPNYNSDFLFKKWLESENIPQQCIENFWEPLILSSLCDTIENVSFDAVQKVVRDGLLAGRNGLKVHIPNKPLRTIYHDKVSEKLKSMGVNLHFLSRITALRWELRSERNSEQNSDRNKNSPNENYVNENNNEYISDITDNNTADNSNNLSEPNNIVDNVDKHDSSNISDETEIEFNSETNLESLENINIQDTDNLTDSDPFLQTDTPDCRVPVITGLEFSDGEVRSFDRYVLAVPAFRAREIFESSELETFSDSLGLAGFEPGAITSIHLWLNCRLLSSSNLYTALIGGVGQFLFCPQGVQSQVGGFYHLVLISASHRILSELELTSAGAVSLVDRVIKQLESTFKVRESLKLFHYRVTTFFDAVFSPHPLVYSNRPSQKTAFKNFAIAGDWTQTEWPSTLEGAIRSGIIAVDSIDYDSE